MDNFLIYDSVYKVHAGRSYLTYTDYADLKSRGHVYLIKVRQQVWSVLLFFLWKKPWDEKDTGFLSVLVPITFCSGLCRTVSQNKMGPWVPTCPLYHSAHLASAASSSS